MSSLFQPVAPPTTATGEGISVPFSRHHQLQQASAARDLSPPKPAAVAGASGVGDVLSHSGSWRGGLGSSQNLQAPPAQQLASGNPYAKTTGNASGNGRFYWGGRKGSASSLGSSQQLGGGVEAIGGASPPTTTAPSRKRGAARPSQHSNATEEESSSPSTSRGVSPRTITTAREYDVTSFHGVPSPTSPLAAVPSPVVALTASALSRVGAGGGGGGPYTLATPPRHRSTNSNGNAHRPANNRPSSRSSSPSSSTYRKSPGGRVVATAQQRANSGLPLAPQSTGTTPPPPPLPASAAVAAHTSAGDGGIADDSSECSSSSDVEMPQEQSASERPVLFHRVERWLDDKVFSLEVDDFELRGGGIGGGGLASSPAAQLRRPGTAHIGGSGRLATMGADHSPSPIRVEEGNGGSSLYAQRYRRTVESYGRLNDHHGGGGAAAAAARRTAVDDMGFDSMMPMPMRRAVGAEAEGGRRLSVGGGGGCGGGAANTPSPASPISPSMETVAEQHRRLAVKAATERLWRSRIQSAKRRGDGSGRASSNDDSSEGSDASSSD